MLSKKSHLIIVCSNFPYGYGEPFLEVELEYLVKRFDRITICRTDESGKAESFNTPSNVNLVSVFSRVSFLEKLTSIWRLLFDAEIREEMQVIRSHYHSSVTLGRLKTMVSSKIRALKIKKGLERLMVQTTDYETYLYSYWTDDAALAISFIRSENQRAVAFSRIHGWDLYFERNSYHYLPFRKTIFNGLDAVFAISENGKNYLLSHFDTIISRGRIFQSRLGIRTVNQSEDYSRTFRRFRLVSCSNLIAIKRVGLIVQALSNIDDLEIDWIHFGSGVEESAIKELAEELLGTKDNIDFHFPGRVANWQVLKYYSEHMVDLFISLSQYDGIPVSIMEAMSFGIPAIATNVGGVSEIVINGKTGFLLDQDIDPKHVAYVIENVAKLNSDAYEAMRSEARKMWGTFYSADINYPAFCDKVLSLKQS
ncbi:MAG: glycosyltransferase [Flavobacteriales bacterium]|nr:glycosyltransferase [Flavobacteriales bacterium]